MISSDILWMCDPESPTNEKILLWTKAELEELKDGEIAHFLWRFVSRYTTDKLLENRSDPPGLLKMDLHGSIPRQRSMLARVGRTSPLLEQYGSSFGLQELMCASACVDL